MMVDLNVPGSVERAIALADITAALQRYAARARDDVDWAAKAEAFAPDGRLVLPNGTVLPVSQMRDLVRGQEAEYYRHHVGAIDVTFASQTKAYATTQHFTMTHKSSCDHWGDWRDTLVKSEDGRWLIEEKKLVVDGCDPKGWYASVYGQI